MKRPESHRIQEEAENLLRLTLPVPWVKQPQTPDYGIDYEVQVADGDDVTGLRFAVQVKGVVAKRLTSGKPRYPIESAHLDFYLKQRIPVYLFVIHNRKGIGYWVFLQEYARTKLKDKDWRKQSKVTIYLPPANLLSDAKLLRESVEAADKYMAALHPAAIPVAIKAAREKLESLDPRFKVEIHATEKGTNHILHAKEAVTIQASFHGSPHTIREKLTNLLGRGIPVEFQPGEVDFTGSPIFHDIAAKGVTVHAAHTLPCTVDITTIDSDGRITGSITVPATASGGSTESRIYGNLPDAPLSVQITELAATKSTPPAHSATLSFNAEIWAGQKLAKLAYFDFIKLLFDPSVAQIKIAVMDRGNLVGAGRIETVSMESITPTHMLLEVIGWARDLAKRFAVDPVLPHQLSEKSVEEVMELHDFVNRIKEPEAFKEHVITTDLVPRDISDLETMAQAASPTELRLGSDGKKFPFFGLEIAIGPHEHIITNVVFHSTVEELKDSFEKSGRVSAKATLHTTESSTMGIRLLEPELKPASPGPNG